MKFNPFSFPVALSYAAHIAAGFVYYATFFTPVVPDNYKPLVAGLVATAQAIVGIAAHYSMPPNQ